MLIYCIRLFCDWLFHLCHHYYYFTPWEFFTTTLADSLSMEFEWQQVSSLRALLSILAGLNNVVVWMFSTCPLISRSSSPYTNPLVIVLRVRITIGITVTFMFPSTFNFLARSRYFLLIFNFLVSRDSKVHNSANSLFFFLLIIIRSGHLAEISWSVCISKPHCSLCVSFFRTDSGLCIYHLFVWSNLNFLHSSLWNTLPTQWCLVLYSFCANLLHLLIVWLIVSSLSPISAVLLHLIYSCFDMIGPYGVVLYSS